MNALPVLVREMIVRARSPRMHWMRLALAAFGVLFSLQYFLFWTGSGLVQAGGYAFQTLAWMAFLSAGAGFVLTADSVSAERRGGTLGLLFLTRVGSADVLAGKLASAGLGALLGLVAIGPVLMLPVLAGGVRWTQAVLVTVSLPGLLFFSLCAGLWGSSKSTRVTTAFMRSAGVLMVIGVLPLLLGSLQMAAGAVELGRWMSGLSPGAAFLWGSRTTASFSDAGYWTSVAAGFVFGSILLMAAMRVLRRNWRDEAGSEAISNDPSGRRSVPLGDESPVQWLVRRSSAQPRALWLGVGLLLLPRFLNVAAVKVGLSAVGIITAINLTTSVAAALLFSYAGAMFFLEGRRIGALELLRTTPVGVARGVSDQWEILRRRCAGPLVVWVTIGILMLLVGRIGFSGADLVILAVQGLIGMAGTVFDVIALCWLGMWFGYRSSTTWSALLWPVGLVTGLDLLFTYVLYGVFAVLLQSAGFRGGFGTVFVLFYMILPGLIVIAKQIWLIRWARRRLKDLSEGAPMEPVDLRRSLASSVRRARRAVQKARHWT